MGKDVGLALFPACDISDVMCLAKVSETVRRNIYITEEIIRKFSGYFDRNFVIDSVPRSLVELVYMIQHGPDIKSQIMNGQAKLKSHRKWTKYVNTRDTQVIAIYVGLHLYAMTR